MPGRAATAPACLNTDFTALRSGFTQPGYNPYDDYHRLRAHAPVWHAPWGDWYLSSYQAVASACTHGATRSRRGLAEAPMPAHIARFFSDWLLFLDPPEHTRLRCELMGMFMPSRISDLQPAIARIAEELTPRGKDGHFDFVGAFAKPLPVMVIADFIGMPPADQVRIPAWADVVRGAFDDLPHAKSRLPEAVADMQSYFLDLVSDAAWRRRVTDFEGVLGAYPKEPLAAHLAFLVFAGHETTAHLLGSMLLHLAMRPLLWRRLRDAPELAKLVVVETLRFESPVQKIVRRTAEATQIGDQIIPKDQSLVLLLGAANRDPDQFAKSDEYLIDRAPQSQIAFGWGSHLCLGRSLALLEATVALQVLLRSWRVVGLADGGHAWHANASFRGLEYLNLAWHVEESA